MVEEYPRNLTELEANFGTEAACRAYLIRLRWPDGFRCPRCGGERSWPVRGVLLECSRCGCQTSVTAGTIFQDTRTPFAGLVPSHVVGDHAKERRQCPGTAACARTQEL